MKNAQLKNNKGFTLIELMIVVAIIGILAIIALPAYQNFTDKAKYTELTNASSGLKTSVEICVQVTGAAANCDDGQNGLPAAVPAAAGVVGLTVTDGVITVSAPTDATGAMNGATYTLTPAVAANGKVTWTPTCNPLDLC